MQFLSFLFTPPILFLSIRLFVSFFSFLSSLFCPLLFDLVLANHPSLLPFHLLSLAFLVFPFVFSPVFLSFCRYQYSRVCSAYDHLWADRASLIADLHRKQEAYFRKESETREKIQKLEKRIESVCAENEESEVACEENQETFAQPPISKIDHFVLILAFYIMIDGGKRLLLPKWVELLFSLASLFIFSLLLVLLPSVPGILLFYHFRLCLILAHSSFFVSSPAHTS